MGQATAMLRDNFDCGAECGTDGEKLFFRYNFRYLTQHEDPTLSARDH